MNRVYVLWSFGGSTAAVRINWNPMLYSQGMSNIPPKILLMNNDYLKNESISRYHNYCQIQIGIPACVMSSEYFKRTSLYLVRLQIFEWIKFLRGHLHQIQGNWDDRNFLTALMYLKSTTTAVLSVYQWILLSNNKSVYGILGGTLTWLDCNILFLLRNIMYIILTEHYFTQTILTCFMFLVLWDT